MVSVRRTLISLALIVPAIAVAQQPQAQPRVLTVASTNATAASEFQAGTEAGYHWSNPTAAAHLSKALELDVTFGLSRAYLARTIGGPTARGEFERAATEAARGSAVEALLALAMREVNQGRATAARTILDAAVALAPDDPRVAFEQANGKAGAERLDGLRQVSARFPQFAPSRMFLAVALTPNTFDSLPRAAGDEALRVAQEALQIAPNMPGSHAAVGWVLVRMRRYDEALAHLTHATTIGAPNEYAFESKADIAIHTGKPAAARAALDSAYANSVTIGNRSTYRRNRALMFVHEGKVREAMAAFDTLAREDEAAGRTGQVAATRGWMALISAAGRDSTQVEAHLAAARPSGPPTAGTADSEINAYFVSGQGAKARASLTRYIELTRDAPNQTLRMTNVHRLTGLTLVAEGNAREAIAELKQGGNNPYAQLGLVEAYRQLKDKKAYEAEKAAFLARQDWTYQSTAFAIGKYRVTYLK